MAEPGGGGMARTGENPRDLTLLLLLVLLSGKVSFSGWRLAKSRGVGDSCGPARGGEPWETELWGVWGEGRPGLWRERNQAELSSAV